MSLALLRTRPNDYYSETIHHLLTDPNINVGGTKPDFVKQNAKRTEDEWKFSTKLGQDHKWFYKVEEAANEKDTSKRNELLKEVEKLLKPENRYGFKLSVNYSPNVSGKGATVEVAIKAGGKLLQLLYDYAEKNIGTDTKIFKQLKQAKENAEPNSDVSNVSNSGNLIQPQGFKLDGA